LSPSFLITLYLFNYKRRNLNSSSLLCLSVTQGPNAGPCRLFVEVSRSHTIRHTKNR